MTKQQRQAKALQHRIVGRAKAKQHGLIPQARLNSKKRRHYRLQPGEEFLPQDTHKQIAEALGVPPYLFLDVTPIFPGDPEPPLLVECE